MTCCRWPARSSGSATGCGRCSSSRAGRRTTPPSTGSTCAACGPAGSACWPRRRWPPPTARRWISPACWRSRSRSPAGPRRSWRRRSGRASCGARTVAVTNDGGSPLAGAGGPGAGHARGRGAGRAGHQDLHDPARRAGRARARRWAATAPGSTRCAAVPDALSRALYAAAAAEALAERLTYVQTARGLGARLRVRDRPRAGPEARGGLLRHRARALVRRPRARADRGRRRATRRRCWSPPRTTTRCCRDDRAGATLRRGRRPRVRHRRRRRVRRRLPRGAARGRRCPAGCRR